MKLQTGGAVTAERPGGPRGVGAVRRGIEPAHGEDVIESAPQVLKLKRILVPVDFSARSVKALAYAVQLAKQFDAKVTLLHVSQARFYANEFAYLPIEETAMKEGNRERLKALAADIVEPEFLGATLVRYGVPFDEISKAAREIDADMIVINTHGYTGLKHIVMGSTAERVVRYAPCPVFVVREREVA